MEGYTPKQYRKTDLITKFSFILNTMNFKIVLILFYYTHNEVKRFDRLLLVYMYNNLCIFIFCI